MCLGYIYRKRLLRHVIKIIKAKKGKDDIEISYSQIQLTVRLRGMRKLEEADKLFQLPSERIEEKHAKNNYRCCAGSVETWTVRLKVRETGTSCVVFPSLSLEGTLPIECAKMKLHYHPPRLCLSSFEAMPQ